MLPEIKVDWLLARVRDNGEGCLIWTGFSQNGDPKATAGNNGVPYNVRRAVWRSMHGREPRKNYRVVSKCGTYNCVGPECLVEEGIGAALRGRVLPRDVRIKLAMVARAKSILTEEALNEIKAGNEKQQTLAAKHGISQALVSRVQLGKTWADFTSPFAGLGG
ncbi:MAG: hypothetical protein KF686_03485 [Ramlibacter sp.]|nr:hypothetical protein [Ramlibacter sp.]